MRSVAYDNGIDTRLMTVFLVEFGLGSLDETVSKILFHNVYGTSTEPTAHNARAGDTAHLGNINEEVKILAAHLVVV